MTGVELLRCADANLTEAISDIPTDSLKLANSPASLFASYPSSKHTALKESNPTPCFLTTGTKSCEAEIRPLLYNDGSCLYRKGLRSAHLSYLNKGAVVDAN